MDARNSILACDDLGPGRSGLSGQVSVFPNYRALHDAEVGLRTSSFT